jgi:hypothetical protein
MGLEESVLFLENSVISTVSPGITFIHVVIFCQYVISFLISGKIKEEKYTALDIFASVRDENKSS